MYYPAFLEAKSTVPGVYSVYEYNHREVRHPLPAWSRHRYGGTVLVLRKLVSKCVTQVKPL